MPSPPEMAQTMPEAIEPSVTQLLLSLMHRLSHDCWHHDSASLTGRWYPKGQYVTHTPLAHEPPSPHVVSEGRYCPVASSQHSPPQQTAPALSLHETQHAALESHSSPMAWSMVPSPHAKLHELAPSPPLLSASVHL